jgi:hypothetical protein
MVLRKCQGNLELFLTYVGTTTYVANQVLRPFAVYSWKSCIIPFGPIDSFWKIRTVLL